jgi:hypothetical protein
VSLGTPPAHVSPGVAYLCTYVTDTILGGKLFRAEDGHGDRDRGVQVRVADGRDAIDRDRQAQAPLQASEGLDMGGGRAWQAGSDFNIVIGIIGPGGAAAIGLSGLLDVTAIWGATAEGGQESDANSPARPDDRSDLTAACLCNEGITESCTNLVARQHAGRDHSHAEGDLHRSTNS